MRGGDRCDIENHPNHEIHPKSGAAQLYVRKRGGQRPGAIKIIKLLLNLVRYKWTLDNGQFRDVRPLWKTAGLQNLFFTTRPFLKQSKDVSYWAADAFYETGIKRQSTSTLTKIPRRQKTPKCFEVNFLNILKLISELLEVFILLLIWEWLTVFCWLGEGVLCKNLKQVPN